MRIIIDARAAGTFPGFRTRELRDVVERLLTRARGEQVRVISIQGEASPYATLSPAHVLSAKLLGGESVALFLKQVGDKQTDHPEKAQRDREIMVYERLLRDPALPVPSYYGSARNAATQRVDLFLEHVDGWNLKYQPLEHWFTAARRLAHLHRHFAAIRDELMAAEYLLRFDEAYLLDWVDRSVRGVGERFPDLARELEDIVRGVGPMVGLLTGQPSTLVHNDPSPKNVVADTSSSPARICFVDWEMAGIGCGLLDLVHLRYGLERPFADRMLETYASELEGTGLIPIGPELDQLVAACELEKTLYRLAFSSVWHLPRERVREWVAESRELLPLCDPGGSR